MDIRITKTNVTYCTVCNEVSELRQAWEENQKLAVENGEQEDELKFPGMPGYIIKDADDFKYSHSEICENCMSALMKGITIMKNNGLTGISLNSHK